MFNATNVDMSGYFDEAAEVIGSNFQLMAPVMAHIRRTIQRGGSGMQIRLQTYEQKDAQRIQNICRQLKEWTFFSNCSYKKQDKTLHLGFQVATAARQFMSGGWLEWFALGIVLSELRKKQGSSNRCSFSIARGLTLQYDSGHKNELDVAALYGEKLFTIECKSGEFRGDIEKMQSLARRLSLPKERFIVLAADLDEEQTKALGAMYPLHFTTLPQLRERIAALLSM